MQVPSVKEIIFYRSELNALRAEGVLDLWTRSHDRHLRHVLMLDVDGSRKLREIGILLRLQVIERLVEFVNGLLESSELALWCGNDEIVILLRGATTTSVIARADAIRAAIATLKLELHEPVENVSFRGSVTVTGGFVGFDEGDDVSAILQLAKARILTAKELGRNRIDATSGLEYAKYDVPLTAAEQGQLEALGAQRGRSSECLLREAVDTLLLHYPQFHGHRRDRETKMPPDAFSYACTPGLSTVDGPERSELRRQSKER